MLHPSQIDFSRPVDYVAALWDELDIQGGGTIAAGDWGIEIASGGGVNDYTHTQRKPMVQAETGKLILLAARVRLPSVSTCRFWFGWWPDGNGPLSSEPSTVAFQKYGDGAAVRGRTKIGLNVSDTSDLFSLTDGADADLGIIIHETARADFVWARGDGTWGSAVLDQYIHAIAMRPSFVYRKNGASGPAIVRSLHIEELRLRE